MCYNKPMKVKLITVGKLKEKYLKDGIAEFVKRLGRFTKFESIELTDEKTPDNASEASITAKPFFLRRGYVVVSEQTVERQGVQLTNFLMIKKRSAPTKNGV